LFSGSRSELKPAAPSDIVKLFNRNEFRNKTLSGLEIRTVRFLSFQFRADFSFFRYIHDDIIAIKWEKQRNICN